MERLKKEEEVKSKGIKPYITNPKYNKISYQLKKQKKLSKVQADPILKKPSRARRVRACRPHGGELVRERRKHRSSIPNPVKTRLEYVRYADD
jgi:hypothetical protein